MSNATRAWLRGASTVIDVRGSRGRSRDVANPVTAAWEMVGGELRGAMQTAGARPAKPAKRAAKRAAR